MSENPQQDPSKSPPEAAAQQAPDAPHADAAAPVPFSAAALEQFARGMAELAIPKEEENFQSINSLTDTAIARMDEFTTLLSNFRESQTEVQLELLPDLFRLSQNLESTFGTLDKVEVCDPSPSPRRPLPFPSSTPPLPLVDPSSAAALTPCPAPLHPTPIAPPIGAVRRPQQIVGRLSKSVDRMDDRVTLEERARTKTSGFLRAIASLGQKRIDPGLPSSAQLLVPDGEALLEDLRAARWDGTAILHQLREYVRSLVLERPAAPAPASAPPSAAPAPQGPAAPAASATGAAPGAAAPAPAAPAAAGAPGESAAAPETQQPPAEAPAPSDDLSPLDTQLRTPPRAPLDAQLRTFPPPAALPGLARPRRTCGSDDVPSRPPDQHICGAGLSIIEAQTPSPRRGCPAEGAAPAAAAVRWALVPLFQAASTPDTPPFHCTRTCRHPAAAAAPAAPIAPTAGSAEGRHPSQQLPPAFVVPASAVSVPACSLDPAAPKHVVVHILHRQPALGALTDTARVALTLRLFPGPAQPLALPCWPCAARACPAPNETPALGPLFHTIIRAHWEPHVAASQLAATGAPLPATATAAAGGSPAVAADPIAVAPRLAPSGRLSAQSLLQLALRVSLPPPGPEAPAAPGGPSTFVVLPPPVWVHIRGAALGPADPAAPPRGAWSVEPQPSPEAPCMETLEAQPPAPETLGPRACAVLSPAEGGIPEGCALSACLVPSHVGARVPAWAADVPLVRRLGAHTIHGTLSAPGGQAAPARHPLVNCPGFFAMPLCFWPTLVQSR
ncbi:hypothetical protein PAPYR_2600 [Paratrimastix pyriformis]|uniref:Uncharacterized protein n=1 Tax=Paratrimastix pyriformis TaxID=342808 RepID=A0ABQ8UQL9_9EUKA|nr:hypothetical protein PAPYR_2600 [Paratrimastix pyriformis]